MLARLVPQGPLTLIDTHAGAGLYYLGGEASRRSGEARAGVAQLMSAVAPPPALQALAEAVRRCNETTGADREALRLYPGSPWLASRALTGCDAYVGCELDPDASRALRAAVPPRLDGPRLELAQADGYAFAQERLRTADSRLMLLIDPPFERGDDYARTAALIAARPSPERQPALIWTPLKDLETLDGFLAALEAGRPASLVCAQARLRPLDDPMKMNGCAVVLVDAPDVTAEALAVCRWVSERLGGPGGVARVDRL